MLKGKHDLGHGWTVYVGRAHEDSRPTLTFTNSETEEATFLDADSTERLRQIFADAYATA